LPVGKHPYGISTYGDYIYTANVYDDSISIVDINSWEKIDISVGHHPYNIIQEDHYLFVTNSLDDNISVIDLNTLKEEQKIATGETPENLWVDQINNKLIVTNWGSDSITIIDLKNFKDTREIKSGLQNRAFGDFIVN